AWMYTNGIDPANVVIASAIFSWTSSARWAVIAALTGWTRRTDSLVEAMAPNMGHPHAGDGGPARPDRRRPQSRCRTPAEAGPSSGGAPRRREGTGRRRH